MVDTLHDVPRRTAGTDTRAFVTGIDLAPRPTADPVLDAPEEVSRPESMLHRFRLAIYAAICAASFTVGALAMRWALNFQGHHAVSIVAILLLPAVIVAFVIPEILEARSRRRAARRG
jgi:hypothetical protein